MFELLQANYLGFFYWVLITSARASFFIICLLGVKFVLRHKMGAGFHYLLWLVLIIGLLLPRTIDSPVSIYNYLNPFQIRNIINLGLGQTKQLSATNHENERNDLVQANVMSGNSNEIVMGTKVQQLSDDTPFIYKLMLIIWFSGVLLLTVLTVIVNKRFSNKIEHSLMTDQELLSEFGKRKTELKIKAEISLRKSRQVNSPSLVGLIHPRLLLPAGIEQTLNLEQINHVFLHELIHYKRKDLWINWLAQILIICHWFNPLIWYGFHRMREDQEISCDALVTSRINAVQSNDYAYTLVKLAEIYSSGLPIPGLTSLYGSNSQIKKRLIILKSRKHQQISLKWICLGVAAISLIALATFTGAQVDANPASAESQNPSTFQGIRAGQGQGVSAGIVDTSSGITVKDITGPNYKGKVMLIKDPTRVKLAVTKDLGITGERVSDLVKDMGAVAGINGGAFYDPDGKGNGGLPDGLTVQDGRLVHNNVRDQAVNIAGFNDKGKLIIGNMMASQLEENHIQEAVSIIPNLVVDGKSAIEGDGGWGVAPRTGIGQMADGTVIFVVIDGRQPGWSIGANISELAKVFEDYHAVNAVNLDGGSSSEIFYQGKVVNKLANVFGERYVPTAFVVMP